MVSLFKVVIGVACLAVLIGGVPSVAKADGGASVAVAAYLKAEAVNFARQAAKGWFISFGPNVDKDGNFEITFKNEIRYGPGGLGKETWWVDVKGSLDTGRFTVQGRGSDMVNWMKASVDANISNWVKKWKTEVDRRDKPDTYEFKVFNNSSQRILFAVSEWCPKTENDHAGHQVNAWYWVEKGQTRSYWTSNTVFHVHIKYNDGSSVVPDAGSRAQGREDADYPITNDKTNMFWCSDDKKWFLGTAGSHTSSGDENATKLMGEVVYQKFFPVKTEGTFTVRGGGPALARTTFRYAGGEFVKGADGTWTEKRKNGGDSSFKEVARTAEFVELYDEERKMKVRLIATAGTFWNGKDWVQWEGAEGKWTE